MEKNQLQQSAAPEKKFLRRDQVFIELYLVEE